ncbi:MAG: hypothetical protein EZS28_043422 [Streblomastix strix]|uniref:Uncharacterized protein n=1 Tax=Streblomastix strix TaxID=222440 RepID=A0A5J4TU39_9EUKA|nr:MAG: hypothetical protein EZS28_043422 [Streblomastix strix]
MIWKFAQMTMKLMMRTVSVLELMESQLIAFVQNIIILQLAPQQIVKIMIRIIIVDVADPLIQYSQMLLSLGSSVDRHGQQVVS